MAARLVTVKSMKRQSPSCPIQGWPGGDCPDAGQSWSKSSRDQPRRLIFYCHPEHKTTITSPGKTPELLADFVNEQPMKVSSVLCRSGSSMVFCLKKKLNLGIFGKSCHWDCRSSARQAGKDFILNQRLIAKLGQVSAVKSKNVPQERAPVVQREIVVPEGWGPG